MASPADSADEGEIVEAPPLPRNDGNGDVDRSGRHRGRISQTPEDDARSRHSGEGYSRRSRSPRGWKRPRDDRDDRDRRDPRQFRVHYEQGSREDRRHARDRDLDRPVSRGSYRNGDDRSHAYSGNREEATFSRHSTHRTDTRNRDREFDRNLDGYTEKRPRHRSRSPRDRRERGTRDRARHGIDQPQEQNKYSAQVERRPRYDNMSKRAAQVEDSSIPKHDTKTDQGATVERGINGLAISKSG